MNTVNLLSYQFSYTHFNITNNSIFWADNCSMFMDFSNRNVNFVLLSLYVIHENYSDKLHVSYILITTQTSTVVTPSKAFIVAAVRML